jgi:hypothetical protein
MRSSTWRNLSSDGGMASRHGSARQRSSDAKAIGSTGNGKWEANSGDIGHGAATVVVGGIDALTNGGWWHRRVW